MKMNFIRKITAFILVTVLIMAGITFGPSSLDEVQAVATTIGECYVEQLEISDWKTSVGVEVPTPQNVSEKSAWIFSGWYQDASCGNAVSSNITEGMYYAKFVPAEVLQVKCQLSNATFVEDSVDYHVLRMVTSVDSLRYKNVGFVISVDGTKINYSMDRVSKFIKASGNTEDYSYYPTIFHSVSTRFATANMKIENTEEALNEAMTITPYWTTLDGTIVEGVVRELPEGLKDASQNADSVTREDTDWYNESETTFTIYNAAELYGFATLVNGGNSFEDKTVSLGNDIFVNAGDATDWSTTAPLNEWTPIGNTTDNAFSGTFDGRGYTISGIYCNLDDVNGLFGATTGESIIKNIKLLNSYFYSDDNNGLTVASIVARGGGKIDSVYSNAIIETDKAGDATTMVDGHYVGGIMGLADKTNSDINNCWFAGSIVSVGRAVGGLVGAVRNQTNNTTIEFSIRHCLNSGTSIYSTYTTGSSYRIGGVCGFAYAQNGNVELVIDDCLNNCLFKRMSTQSITNTGALMGRVTANSKVTIKDSYAIDGLGWSYVVDNNCGGTLEGVKDENDLALDLFVEPEEINTNILLSTNYWRTTSTTQILKNHESDTRWYVECSEGTTEFTITTAAELYGLAELTNDGTFADAEDGYVINLGADIIVNAGYAYKWGTEPPTNAWVPIGNSSTNVFAAIFDGRGYTISGIYCTGSSCVGFFGFASKDSEIRNFRLENSYFYATGGTAGACVGSVAARNGGKIDTVYSNASIEALGDSSNETNQFVGGIIGLVETNAAYATPNQISNCWYGGTLLSSMRATGGIVGAVRNNLSATESVYVEIEHCLNTGKIINTWTSTSTPRVGGILGFSFANKGTIYLYIRDCLNVGLISATGNLGYVGSITGRLTAKSTVEITTTYATAESCSKTHDASSASVAEAGMSVQAVPEAELTGVDIFDMIKLNSSYWTALVGTTPVLSSFYSQQ